MMKYNKTQKRFDIGLGLNFRIVEHNNMLRVESNIPALHLKDLNAKTILDALTDINDILQREPLYKHTGQSYFKAFIRENNIKELL